MAPSTFRGEVECKVSARRLWCAGFEFAPQYLPKALPDLIQAVDDSSPFAPGCIRTITFHKSNMDKYAKEKLPNVSHEVASLVKEKIEEVDPHTFKYKGVVLEGGFLGSLFKSYKHSVHIKEAGPDSCVAHYAFEYDPIHDQHKHQFPEEVKGVPIETFKAVEAYLLTHNDFL